MILAKYENLLAEAGSKLGTALRSFLLTGALLLLASCGGADVGGLFSDAGPDSGAGRPTAQPQVPQPGVQAARVALLLPLSAPGETARIGKAMKQAAELALIDAGNSGITLITKDTGGNAQGAQAAAEAALNEGAEIILGPLLGAEVNVVSPLARQRNISVVAFSSVSAVAGSGTFLMSFLPEEEVLNVVRHAVSSGYRNIAALLPKSQYGATVERALKEAAGSYRARISLVEHYPRTPEGITGPARRIAAATSSGQIQALILPEGGNLLNIAGTVLTQSGYQRHRVKLLGTGLWDDNTTASIPIAQEGWYAGTAPTLVSQFEQRYMRSYNVKPPRLASLAYDAASLVIVLARGPAGNRFGPQQITNPDGFQGSNGLFRFRPDGRIERGLSILEVTSTGARVKAPAPSRF